MITLPPGANGALSSHNVAFIISSPERSIWDRAGLALLPVDEKRKPTGAPALLFSQASWNEWFESGKDVGCKLNLDSMPQGTSRVLVIAYVYGAAESIAFLQSLDMTIDDSLKINVPARDMGDSAVILSEFYLRDSKWKVRALVEGSAYGLAAFGRRIGLDVDDRHPSRTNEDSGGPDRGSDDNCESATGTGFAVSSQHILTCAHVVRGMTRYRMRSLTGSHELDLVMADEVNDLALLRVIGNVQLTPVVFKEGPGISLGEPVVAVGYPLSGLTGGSVAVTQGGVSALTGLRCDSSVLQFTAPIQPGSSGSPLFDMSGQVTGMVTSAIPTAQNMNFAVKSCLAISFLEAAHLTPLRSQTKPTKAAHELVREVQPSLWLMEVSA